MKSKSHEEIELELAGIASGEEYTWGQISLLLGSIEQTAFWRENSSSFTAWVENNAERFGKKPAMLWRILTSGRYTMDVRSYLKGHGVTVPDIEDLSNKISPENIEILAKLERVLPEDKYVELAGRVYLGLAKRAELRSVWQTYRPTLKGRNARGRGVRKPHLDHGDPNEYASFMEATLLDALKTSQAGWTGHDSIKFSKVFLNVNIASEEDNSSQHMFSAVAVVLLENNEMEIHGFKHYYSPLNKRQPEYPEASFCDFFWIMFPYLVKLPTSIQELADDQNMGVICLKDGRISVIKPAKKSSENGEYKEQLVSTLFKRELLSMY